MTSVTLTLTEFLLARIAEDEASARGDDFHIMIPAPAKSLIQWRNIQVTRVRRPRSDIGPARVLAECEAKRQIVEACTRPLPRLCYHPDEWEREQHDPEGILNILAAVYADHPDYLAEWRP